MGDESIEGGMIEIGDPTVEPTAAEPPPRLVIEYRDRGVPWMLIPPMMVLSAVASVMTYTKLSPPPRPVPASASPAPGAVAAETPEGPPPAKPGSSAGIPAEDGPRDVPTSPFELAMGTPPIPAPVPAPAEIAEPEVPLQGSPEPAPFPRVPGLGFDPRALAEANRDPGPPVDQAPTPAAGPQAPRDQPALEAGPATDPAGRGQPEEVDPALLPVDPREARLRRERQVVEARQKAEADRGKFHAELRAICRKSAERAAPEIEALCRKYGVDVDPAIKAQVARMLEVSAAGAGLAVRINLLRSGGFSEPAILSDIFENQGRWDSKATRGGPRSKDEVLCQSARLLLGFPPNRVASPVKPVLTTRAAR